MKSDSMPSRRSYRPGEVRPPHAPSEIPTADARTAAADDVARAAPEHLVVTNDAAEREDVLLGVAGGLAERAGGSVRIAHVYAPPPASVLWHVPVDHGRPVTEVCDRLLRSARDLAGRTGLRVAPELLIGPINPTLTQYVRTNAFDLVTASAGNTWLSLWGYGAWYELARQRPVLVVGPGTSRSWAERPGPSGEVLAVLDGAAWDEAQLDPAVALCRLLDARLTLLRTGPTGPAHVASYRHLLDLARLVERRVTAVRTVAASGPPAEAVLAVQRATGAVVALSAPAGAWATAAGPGRLAARVLRGSTAPVLFHRPTR